MRLADLAKEINSETPADGGIEVSSVTSDSRKVVSGSIFVALTGARADGAAFAADADERGAVAVVAGEGVTLGSLELPILRVADPRRALALLAARLAGAQPRTIVAVTGTSGKTSIAAFVRQIWARQHFPAASIGTIGIVSPKGETYGSLTTPDPVELHRLLAMLARDGVTHAAIEASSHGLDQRRLDGVKLAAGAFTNLSRDHLDYHPTIEAYFAAKMRLFDTLMPKGAPAIVDVDTPWGEAAARHASAAGLRVMTVGRAGTQIRLSDVAPDGFAQTFVADVAGRRHRVRLPLLGTFQISNALVATGLAIATGTPEAEAFEALDHVVGASGRLELIGSTGDGAPVFVDYAHKPDGLEKVIAALRPFTSGRLIVIFGCGGDRDAGKRPIMGEIATRLADVTIVTDDNPRSEEPVEIRRQILVAAPGAIEIGDRASAIRAGVGMLKRGDVLVVAGKGHETGQIVGDRVLPFSDHEAVRAALAEIT